MRPYDRTGADFYRAAETLTEKLGINWVTLQLPIGIEDTFQGIVDLVEMKALIWEGDELGAKYHEAPIPADLADKAAEYRQKLLDTVVGIDEAAMEEYFDKGDVSIETLKRCIKRGTISGEFRPVLCGTAFKNKGVQPLLDAVIEYLPSPIDREGIKVAPEEGQDETADRRVIPANENEPFAGLAFKIINDKYGNLTFVRVYRGVLRSGDQVQNTTKGHKERVGRMFQMHADKREEIKEVFAGDIAAFVGLKDTGTGDTLAAQEDAVVLERMAFPVPVIDISVEPKTKVDQEKMGVALQRLAKEDPSFRVHTDQESGQTIISGMGELHLEIIVDRMKREFKVEANVGKPQVAYRETIRGKVESEGKFVRQSGGRGQYGHVWLKLEPNEQGKGYEFVNGIVGGAVPREFVPAIDKGIREAIDTGVIAGYPIVDVKVTAFDGSYHDVDSSEMAFKIAASIGFKDGVRNAKPVILEPIMKVEVVTPEDYSGDVIGDLNRRRGQITGMDDSPSGKQINASVPLSEMFGYATTVRSMSQGRATFTMEFEKYMEVPPNVADTIINR